MFGYIKPYVPELTVAEYETYRAVYCGLCRSMGRATGQLSRFTLSYDFAFLAIFRMALKRVPAVFDRGGCAAHPLGKRLYIKDNSELEFCARACAVLTNGKIDDDIRDEKGLRRSAVKIASPVARSFERRAGEDASALSALVKSKLGELAEIEKSECDSFDAVCAPSAEMLGGLFSYGLDERQGRIAEVLGQSVGKFIYAADAADDISDDLKNEKYNPLTFIYKNPVEYNNEKKKYVLKKQVSEELYTALGLEINRAASVLDYMDFEGNAVFKGILQNILTLGMRAEARRVLFGSGENENPMKHRI